MGWFQQMQNLVSITKANSKDDNESLLFNQQFLGLSNLGISKYIIKSSLPYFKNSKIKGFLKVR